jgi:16S rRNA (cytidine1402-2'-O)-methyltransferase
VCRELTKIHEEVVRGSAAELASRYATQQAKGEVALVVGAAPEREDADRLARATAALARLVEAGAKPRPAAAVVADLTGVSANELYRALTDSRDA